MTTATDIPTVTFSATDYNAETKEIFINLNDNLWLNELLNEYQVSHRRIFPELNVISPSGQVRSFSFPSADKWELVYHGAKDVTVRLGFKESSYTNVEECLYICPNG